MKAAVLLAVVASVAAQNTYGSYGGNGQGVGGFGSGGEIIFPDYVPTVGRPVFPVRPGQPIQPVQPHRPVQPIRPVQPGRPIQPGLPVQPVRPIQPGLPVQPVRPIQPGLPVQPVRPIQPGLPVQPLLPIQAGGCNSQTLVHAQRGGSDYHFSWCADGGQKYEWLPAIQYCNRLGAGWLGVSIEDAAENQFVTQTISNHQLEYIWTSGQRSSFGWAWASGRPFTPLNWSHTGLDGLPQPDNRENNAENCLGVLNNFYQDGITWHDIACHHTKPIICERSTTAFG